MRTNKQFWDVAVTTVNFVIFLLAVMFWVLSARPANAQGAMLCAPWKDIKAKFAAKYREVPVSSGVVTDKVVMQVLASPGGETWSLVIVHADGSACVSAAGRGWEPGVLPPVASEERS